MSSPPGGRRKKKKQDSERARAWTDGHSYPVSVIHLRSFPWQTRPSICCFWLEITYRARVANEGSVRREGFLANLRGNGGGLAAIFLCLKAVSSSKQRGQRQKSTADCVESWFHVLVLIRHISAKLLHQSNNQASLSQRSCSKSDFCCPEFPAIPEWLRKQNLCQRVDFSFFIRQTATSASSPVSGSFILVVFSCRL